MGEDRSVSQPETKADTKDLYYFDLHSILAFVSGNLTNIALGAAAGAALGLIYLLLTNPSHTAQAQLLIDPGLTRVLREQALEQPMAMDSQQVETEIAILRSEEISQSVVTALGLVNEPEFAVTLMSDYLPDSMVSASTRAAADSERAKRILANFQKSLTIRRIGVSYAIDILYSAKDPELAARIANGVANAYMKFQIDTRTKAAEVGSEWLKGRLADLRQDMNEAARKLQEHRVSQDYSISKTGAMRNPDSAAPASPRSTLEELESAAKTNRQVYDSFMQTYVATVQRQSFPLSNAKIITTASGSMVQSRSLLMVLAMWTLIGAALAAAASWFKPATSYDDLKDGVSRFVSAGRSGAFSRS